MRALLLTGAGGEHIVFTLDRVGSQARCAAVASTLRQVPETFETTSVIFLLACTQRTARGNLHSVPVSYHMHILAFLFYTVELVRVITPRNARFNMASFIRATISLFCCCSDCSLPSTSFTPRFGRVFFCRNVYNRGFLGNV